MRTQLGLQTTRPSFTEYCTDNASAYVPNIIWSIWTRIQTQNELLGPNV